MLAGLAAQTLTVGSAQALWAFAVAATVFVGLLVSMSLAVAVVGDDTLRPLRMAGPGVKRWSGYLLIAVGAWFMLLAAFTDPLLVR